jgi:O-antigen/teichoic acid export membrane protein
VSEAASTRDPRGAVHSTAIVAGSLVAWSIGAYVFFLLAGRLLGPEDYGLAAALLAVIVVGATPLIALQWSSARVMAGGDTTGMEDARGVYRRTLVLATWGAVAVALAASAVVIGVGATGRDIPAGALVATFWALAPFVPLLVATGALQGRHRYWGFAWSYGITGVLRAPVLLLLLAVPFLTGVEATVLGVTIPTALGAVLAIWLSRDLLARAPRPSSAAWRSFGAGLGVATVGLIGIAVLTNVDVIAAKVSLGGAEAGYFGAAAIIAKALMLVPQALTTVLLPRVTERQQRGEPTGSLLAIGVLAMFITGITAMALAVPLEGPITTITFGSAFEPAAGLVVPFFGATTLLGALLILVNHHVARGDRKFAWTVGALAIVQVALLVAYGDSAHAIIAIDAIVAGAGLVIHEVMYLQTDESMLMGAGRQARDVLRRLRSGESGPT